MAESKKDKPESEFYLLYPSKHCRRSDKRELLGHFENLTQVVAAGFDASSEPAMFMSVCVSCPPVTGGSFLITRYQSLDLSAR